MSVIPPHVTSSPFLATPATAWNAAISPNRPRACDAQLDQPAPSDTPSRVIICAGPRTGSNALGRAMLAAGLGIPMEYFLPAHEKRLAERWGIPAPAGRPTSVARYVRTLMEKRSINGVFATKLQFWQLQRALCNPAGQALFAGAHLIYLTRGDAQAQAVSLAVAHDAGSLDSDLVERVLPAPSMRQLRRAVASILREDANFQRFFALSGLRPTVMPYAEVIGDPAGAVKRIAFMVDAQMHGASLAAYLANTGRYGAQRMQYSHYREMARRELLPAAFDAAHYAAPPFGRIRHLMERITRRAI
ncbi:MAG: Stf0 family sulfotransferase [Pseudomonadota bacterium]